MQLEGQQLNDYRLLHYIGSGRIGKVYYAQEEQTLNKFAIRLVESEHTSSDQGEEENNHFQCTIGAIAQLGHPCILPILNYGEDTSEGGRRRYLVMPFRQEGTLTTWLQRRPQTAALSLQDIAHFIKQAADALQYAHDRNIVHQHVRASSFFIQSRPDRPDCPDILLGDFGLEALAARGQEYESLSSRRQEDQYALAIMAYELLTGQPPLPNWQERPLAIQQPETFDQHIVDDLKIVLSHALAQNQQERFATITAFANAFGVVVAQTPLPVKMDNPSTPEQIFASDTGPQATDPRITAVLPPPVFQRSDLDIYITLAISPEEARNGSVRTFTTVQREKVPLTIPAGVQEGQTLRIEGLGLPSFNEDPAGALILTLTIKPPTIGPLTRLRKITTTLLARIGPLMIAIMTSIRLAAATLLARGRPILATLFAIIKATSSALRVQARAAFVALQARIKPHLKDFLRWLEPARNRAIFSSGLALLLLLIGSDIWLFTSRATSGPVSQPIARSNPYPPGDGTLLLADPLQSNASNYGWDVITLPDHSCQFAQGYLVQALKVRAMALCTAQNMNFTNFTFEVKMTFLTNGSGGLLFRADMAGKRFYSFQVSPNGAYLLYLYMNTLSGPSKTLLASTILPAPFFHTGLNQSNTLAVVANGSTIDLYMNARHLQTIHDSSLDHGQIGVIATGETGSQVRVMYSDASVWKL